MPYKLPPLNSLRLFEAAGRHLSFKLAAEELNITASAISHGLQTLEDWLGVALFARHHRALVLTEAGKAYLPRVREALDLLASATEAASRRQPSGRLTVSVAPGFGARWLVPNLSGFRKRHPGIEVVTDTSRRYVEFPRDGVDIAVRRGRGGWPGLSSVCLAMEELVPVCAPQLAPRIALAADLANHPLLHTDIDEDWATWAGLAGVTGLDFSGGLRFDTIHMALEAAAQGLGIAIGRLPLIAADLAAGRLAPVLSPPRRGAVGYWLVTNREFRVRPEVVAFRDWIRAQFQPPPPARPPEPDPRA